MMTTTSTFGPSNVRNKFIHGDNPPVQPTQNTPAALTKDQLLAKTIEEYKQGTITKEQFEVITASLK